MSWNPRVTAKQTNRFKWTVTFIFLVLLKNQSNHNNAPDCKQTSAYTYNTAPRLCDRSHTVSLFARRSATLTSASELTKRSPFFHQFEVMTNTKRAPTRPEECSLLHFSSLLSYHYTHLYKHSGRNESPHLIMSHLSKPTPLQA